MMIVDREGLNICSRSVSIKVLGAFQQELILDKGCVQQSV